MKDEAYTMREVRLGEIWKADKTLRIAGSGDICPGILAETIFGKKEGVRNFV